MNLKEIKKVLLIAGIDFDDYDLSNIKINYLEDTICLEYERKE